MGGLITRKEFGTMIDRLFGDFWNELDIFDNKWPTLSRGRFSYPKWNIKELDTETVIEAGVPGLSKDEVSVEYTDGRLTISGQKKNSVSNDRNGYLVRELHQSSFARTVAVSDDLYDVENIQAEVKEGLLVVKIPKKVVDKPEPKRIIEVK